MQKFNYHSHTYRCKHAELGYTDEEYVLDYIKMGFDKIAFTDHCPEKNRIDKRPHMRMSYGQRTEYLEKIQKLKDKYASQIEIQSGYEVEYLPGEEKNIFGLQQEVDKIILGQHFVYDDAKNLLIFGKADFSDEELRRYANYLEKAMAAELPDIIAHPDLYMLRRKRFAAIEKEVAHLICAAAEKYDIPLEINLNDIFKKVYFEDKKWHYFPLEKQKEKLAKVVYPCKEFWEIAAKYKVKVLYGVDTHFRGQIELWQELLGFTNEILGEELIKELEFVEDV